MTLEAQRSRPYPRSSMTSHPPIARHACPRIADGPAANGVPAQQPISTPPLDESAGPACSEVFTSSQAQNLVCVRVLVCPAVTIPPGRPSPGAIQSGEIAGSRCPRRGRFLCATPREILSLRSRAVAWEDKGDEGVTGIPAGHPIRSIRVCCQRRGNFTAASRKVCLLWCLQ